MPKLHCARGPKRCDTCKEFLEEGESFCLIELWPSPREVTRPMTDVVIEGEKVFADYDVLLRFENEEEAKNYSKEHNIEIIYD